MAKVSPNKQAEIVAMRRAGWTVPAIAERVGVGATTVKRVCARHTVTPGEDHDALVTAARRELTSLLADNERIRAVLAGLVADTLGHVGTARQKAFDALDKLTPTDTKSAALTMRALAGHATALKGHADVLRSLLPRPEADPEELPTLRIVTLTANEVESMREEQRRETALLNGDVDEIIDEGDSDEVEAA